MRRRAVWGGLLLAACTAAAAVAAPTTGLVLLSEGPSPFPEQGCGQVDVDTTSPGRGTVELYGAERGQEADLSVVVDPTDPRRVVAAWVQDSALGIVVASSSDGGRTFARTVVPELTVCNGGSAQHVLHARLAAGPDGTLYLAAETLDGYFPDPRSGVVTIPVSVSHDGGRSWSTPRLLPALPALSGLDTVAAGPDGLVVAWHTPEPVATTYLSTTADEGRTWTRVQVPGGAPDALPAQRVVLAPDGALHVLTVEATVRGFFAGAQPATQVLLGEPGASLVSRTSRDGGATWTDAVVVAPDVPGQWVGAAARPEGGLVTTWRAEATPGCAAPLLSSTSRDGRSWTPPVPITCDAVGTLPSVAVRPDGTIGIATTSATAREQRQQELHLSEDGGASWSAVPLGEPFAPPPQAGFYQETAAGPDAFYSVFARAGAADGERTDAVLGVARLDRRPACGTAVPDRAGRDRRPCGAGR